MGREYNKMNGVQCHQLWNLGYEYSSSVLSLQLSCKIVIILKQKEKKDIAANSPLENDKIVLCKGNQLMIVA